MDDDLVMIAVFSLIIASFSASEVSHISYFKVHDGLGDLDVPLRPEFIPYINDFYKSYKSRDGKHMVVRYRGGLPQETRIFSHDPISGCTQIDTEDRFGLHFMDAVICSAHGQPKIIQHFDKQGLLLVQEIFGYDAKRRLIQHSIHRSSIPLNKMHQEISLSGLREKDTEMKLDREGEYEISRSRYDEKTGLIRERIVEYEIHKSRGFAPHPFYTGSLTKIFSKESYNMSGGLNEITNYDADKNPLWIDAWDMHGRLIKQSFYDQEDGIIVFVRLFQYGSKSDFPEKGLSPLSRIQEVSLPGSQISRLRALLKKRIAGSSGINLESYKSFGIPFKRGQYVGYLYYEHDMHIYSDKMSQATIYLNESGRKLRFFYSHLKSPQGAEVVSVDRIEYQGESNAPYRIDYRARDGRSEEVLVRIPGMKKD